MRLLLCVIPFSLAPFVGADPAKSTEYDPSKPPSYGPGPYLDVNAKYGYPPSLDSQKWAAWDPHYYSDKRDEETYKPQPPPPMEYHYQDDRKKSNVGLILGLALGLPALLIFLAVVVFCCCCRKRCFTWMSRRNLVKAGASSFFESNYYNSDVKKQQTPIDSEDPWAMDRSRVVVEYQNKLGSGAFCNVHKGQIKGAAAIRSVCPDLIVLQRFTDCEVAVKLLPPFADDIARSDFNQEINFMKSLHYHNHLVCMLGYVPDQRNPLLLVEYCSNGDLLHLIRSHRTEIEHGYENSQGLKIKNLVSFSWQISNGLEYLNSIGCIHRDVAARNVLVDSEYTCKIADFGLCRLTDNLLYTARGGRLPLRWMAPESLKSFEYSFKTDVWSYGILLWELLSLGEVPYTGLDNMELLHFLEAGRRLEKPIFCPYELFDVMKACWRADPYSRPDFTEICTSLRGIIEAANDDYGYLIPIASLASIDPTDQVRPDNELTQIDIDDV